MLPRGAGPAGSASPQYITGRGAGQGGGWGEADYRRFAPARWAADVAGVTKREGRLAEATFNASAILPPRTWRSLVPKS